MNITDFLIKQPWYIEYLIWLAAIALDKGLEDATGGLISITKGLSFIISAIGGIFVPGFNLPLTANSLLFFSLCVGVFGAVAWFAKVRLSK